MIVSLLGGYDLLGRTKDQIKTTEQVNAALAACNNLKLDGLVIIGGILLYWSFMYAHGHIASLKGVSKSQTWFYFRCDIKHGCCSACRDICCCKMSHQGMLLLILESVITIIWSINLSVWPDIIFQCTVSATNFCWLWLFWFCRWLVFLWLRMEILKTSLWKLMLVLIQFVRYFPIRAITLV